MDDVDDDIVRKYQRRRRMFLYGSFLVCLLGGAFVGASLGTGSWVTAHAYSVGNGTSNSDYSGDFNSGLFKGKSTLAAASSISYKYYTVCAQGKCMFSCAATAEKRKQHLEMILDDNIEGIEVPPCTDGNTASNTRGASRVSSNRKSRSDEMSTENLLKHPIDVVASYVDVLRRSLQFSMSLETSTQVRHGHDGGPRNTAATEHSQDSTKTPVEMPISESNSINFDDRYYIEENGKYSALKVQVDLQKESSSSVREEEGQSDEVSDAAGLMSEGLWAGTIACLSAGLLFALVGAVFSIVNTATTPVESITGIPGLYIWNSLAALFDLVAVILWAVMFNTKLSSNVLIEQSRDGWTTEGNERLGYSFWLVVVAVVVHTVNCFVIAYGTYEPKLKERIKEPETTTNDILLY